MKRVLVTRPEPGACATAARLSGMGFEPVVLPLSAIVALPVEVSPPACDAVALTSANAVRHAAQGLLRALAGKPCFAVGARTAAAARAAGFAAVREGHGDAADLAAVIGGTGFGVVAYLAGRLRLTDFETALRASGLKVETIETYDTVPVQPSAADLEGLAAGRPIDAVLIYSAEAAKAIAGLTKAPALAETFSRTVHCCLSERIAQRLAGAASLRIKIAERPEEDAILALLDR